MLRLKPLERQTIVITGATSGNGLATAEEAVRRGAAVVLAARNFEALERIRDELTGRGGRIAICPADVASGEDVERIAETAIDAFGGFDSWVNDAAAATYGRMEEVPMEDHRRIFDVNYFGVLKGSLVAARHLKPKGGAIVNLGSVLSDRAMILQGPYSASKHAVQAATDALRMELEREKAPISVTLIKPGSIATPYPEHARNYMGAPPRLPPPLYDPSLVADAILFACQHPRRQIYVGGAGYLISLMGAWRRGQPTRSWGRWGCPLSRSRATRATRPGATISTSRAATAAPTARSTCTSAARAFCWKRRNNRQAFRSRPGLLLWGCCPTLSSAWMRGCGEPATVAESRLTRNQAPVARLAAQG